jgi:hypothetical protein
MKTKGMETGLMEGRRLGRIQNRRHGGINFIELMKM